MFLTAGSGEAHPQAFGQREQAPPEGMTAPLLAKSVPPKAAVTVRGTNGGFPLVGPAQAFIASHPLKDKIPPAPSSGHRFHFQPSFFELDSINLQMSLEVAHETSTFRDSL